jgi:hypothetical protein
VRLRGESALLRAQALGFASERGGVVRPRRRGCEERGQQEE